MSAPGLAAGGRQRRHGIAVVTLLAADHLPLRFVPRFAMVLTGDLDRHLTGFRTAAGEDDAGHAVRTEFEQFLREFDPRIAGEVAIEDEGDFLELRRHLSRHLGHTVADVGDADAGTEVEVLAVLIVIDVHTVGVVDDRIVARRVPVEIGVWILHAVNIRRREICANRRDPRSEPGMWERTSGWRSMPMRRLRAARRPR